jgi:hypothetical protein
MSSSPLYPPQFTPRLLPSRINLDVNTVEGIPGVNASQRYQTPGLVLDEVDELHRLPYSMDQQDVAYKGKARECYLERVMNLGENRIGKRILRLARSPAVPRFPHS